MKLYHGSNVEGLTVLEPSKGVLDANDWAGVYDDGQKVDREVVWYTADFELAIAFSLRNMLRIWLRCGQWHFVYQIQNTVNSRPERLCVFHIRRC